MLTVGPGIWQKQKTKNKKQKTKNKKQNKTKQNKTKLKNVENEKRAV